MTHLQNIVGVLKRNKLIVIRNYMSWQITNYDIIEFRAITQGLID